MPPRMGSSCRRPCRSLEDELRIQIAETRSQKSEFCILHSDFCPLTSFGHLFPVIRFHPGGKNLHCPRQIIAVEYVGDADLVLPLARARVESVCRRDHHRLIVELELFKHEDGEFLAVANRQLGNNVECTTGLAADRARYLRDGIAYQVSPALVLA